MNVCPHVIGKPPQLYLGTSDIFQEAPRESRLIVATCCMSRVNDSARALAEQVEDPTYDTAKYSFFV